MGVFAGAAINFFWRQFLYRDGMKCCAHTTASSLAFDGMKSALMVIANDCTAWCTG